MRAPLDRAALAREITALANGRGGPRRAHDAAASPVGGARRIALTGAPGAGKSTLCGRLAYLRASERRYGVLAIDPSSPRSGGAILGDRIRIDALEAAEGAPADLYVRSLGSRSASDGLADHLPAILDAMDRHGFDEVLLETVGSGQADHAVDAIVDTVVLVLHPESGDVVQAMKAGVMETAHVLVVNKADLPNAAKSAADIRRVLSLVSRPAPAWRPPVLMTSQDDRASIAALSDAIDAHAAWTREHATSRRSAVRRYRLRRELERRMAIAIRRLPDDLADDDIEAQIAWVMSHGLASGDA